MGASYPKNPDLFAFEQWASTKRWFSKVRGNFRRNSNDTEYTHYIVNDRAHAFLAGIDYERSRQQEKVMSKYTEEQILKLLKRLKEQHAPHNETCAVSFSDLDVIASHLREREAAKESDDELPGMWSAADFIGGDPDERSYAEQVNTMSHKDAPTETPDQVACRKWRTNE